MLAELLENATTFSPKTTQVIVSGHPVRGGGLTITITDAGMGVPEDHLAELNWQLANPAPAGLAVTRQMGLFAVAHLAARHHITVVLGLPPDGGTTAEVYLPAALISPDVPEPEAAEPGGAVPTFDFVGSRYPQALTGLPQRIPQPGRASGAAASQAARPAAAAESAETTREQLASFQRGSRRAREAVQADRARQPARDR
jgi:hypothetical protein